MMHTNPTGKGARAHGPPPDTAPASAPRRTLTYTRGVWGEADDPLTEEGGFEKVAAAAGYYLLNTHGVEDSDLWAEVFAHETGDKYLVVVNTVTKFHTILVPDAPSLSRLLGELLPVIEASLRLKAAAEEHKRALKARRKGGVYNAAKRCMEVP